MRFLRKLAKWLLVVVILLVFGLIIFVWPVLGVNPFEGDVDNLWDLVSNEVDFFVRSPGASALDEPLAESLQYEEGYDFILTMREDLARLTSEIAAQANPQIPMGLVEVDFRRDFVGKEMAIAGTIRTDFATLKLDNFIALTRVAFYGRFMSALQRGFVRSQIPDGDRIEPVKGYYFRVKLTDEEATLFQSFRTIKGRSEPNTIYFGRIKDVVLISDTPRWIEAAIKGGQETLPADPWFDTEFVKKSRGGRSFELFVRPNLSANVMIHHGREETGGPLVNVRKILPLPMTGEVTVVATPGSDGIGMTLSNNPPPEGYKNVRQPHLHSLYERVKADLRFDLSDNGIGRFIPTRRTVGALVVHADPELLVDLVLDLMPASERQLLDEGVRDNKNTRYRGIRDLLLDLARDLDETHMVVLHRHSEFDKYDLSLRTDPEPVDPEAEYIWAPEGQFTYTLVSKVKDTVAPDKVRQKLFANLSLLSLNAHGTHKSGKFHLAKVIGDPERLLEPAYGALGGTKFFVLSSSVEGAEAVFEAAENPQERLLGEPGVLETVQRINASGSLAFLARGDVLRKSLGDRVREYAQIELDGAVDAARIRKRWQDGGFKGTEEQLTDTVLAEVAREKDQRYPEIYERYMGALAWLESVETFAVSATLGIGPYKQVRAKAYTRFRKGEGQPADE